MNNKLFILCLICMLVILAIPKATIAMEDDYVELIARVSDNQLSKKTRVSRVLYNTGFRNQRKLTPRTYTFRVRKDEVEAKKEDLMKMGLFKDITEDVRVELDSKSFNSISYSAAVPDFDQDQDVIINDPESGNQNYLTQLEAKKAWKYSKGSGVIVAVIDTGVDASHPDLSGKVIGRPGHPEDLTDSAGHGTRVAGVIAAKQNNGQGISGIAPDATILSINASWGNSLSLAKIIQALEEAYQNGAKVIQMSFGLDTNNPIFQEEIELALSRGIVLVATTGNAGLNKLRYPAAYNGVIGVGSIQSNSQISAFSNRGAHVSLVAYGDPTFTTVKGGYYGSFQGTSFASPQISGIAALMRSINPSLSGEEIRTLLLQSAQDIGPPGIETTYGYGKPDAHKAVLFAHPSY